MTDRELLDEQIAYYRARAAEYDATSPSEAMFGEQMGRVRAAIAGHGPRGRALEIAAGTGLWTAHLADQADSLLVTDAAPEMLELNRARLGERPHVSYEVADAFALEPTHDFDGIFFAAFMSHVPPGRFEAFWGVLEGLVAPDGLIFFVDEADHGLWEEDWIDREAGLIWRPLADGSRHRAIKVLWRPDDLVQRLTELGWTASVQLDPPFYWGTARR